MIKCKNMLGLCIQLVKCFVYNATQFPLVSSKSYFRAKPLASLPSIIYLCKYKRAVVVCLANIAIVQLRSTAVGHCICTKRHNVRSCSLLFFIERYLKHCVKGK